MTDAIMIGVIVLIVAICVVVRFVVSAAMNKASDALVNAKYKAENKSSPPKQESLADRYAKQDKTKSDQ